MKISYKAANAGFAYSHIMVNSQVLFIFIVFVSFVPNIVSYKVCNYLRTMVVCYLKLCYFLIQPYNIGIVSARPFTVLAEYGPPLFQRGVLHVYYHDLQLHVFIVHLHAHSSRVRIQEAKNLLDVCVMRNVFCFCPLRILANDAILCQFTF